MRVAFFGTPAAAVPSLEALADAAPVHVAAVVTNPDRPAGRGHRLTPPPVKQAAVARGITVWQPRRAREILDDLRRLRIDACAVVAYGALLPQDVLDAGGHGFVNLHFSLLPAWRGAAPVTHALLTGAAVTGVSCFVLEAGMDTGPVLAQLETRIGAQETAGELTQRLATLGAPLLVDAVRGLVTGTLERQPQDHAAASYAPKVHPDDARLDWHQPAAAVQRVVRAFNPVPGAHTTLAGARLKVHRATARAMDHAGLSLPGALSHHEAINTEPGAVVALDAGAPVVACGEATALRLDEVQPAGRPRMSGAAFARGHAVLHQRLG